MLNEEVSNMMNPFTKFEALSEIIRDLEDLVRPEDTGHIRTSIAVLTEMKEELRGKLTNMYDKHRI